jgi:hypothetical protein
MKVQNSTAPTTMSENQEKWNDVGKNLPLSGNANLHLEETHTNTNRYLLIFH